MPEDFSPEDLREHTEIAEPSADSISLGTVMGDDKLYLYLWDSDTHRPVASVVGLDAAGVEKFQKWLTNADIEARQVSSSEYGASDDEEVSAGE